MVKHVSKELRVWWIVNVPNKPIFTLVKNVEEAKVIIKREIKRQLKDSSISSNVFGLEEFEDGEWREYYNDDSEDIMEMIDNGK